MKSKKYQYKILVDFRKHNVWVRKHPKAGYLPFGNVPFKASETNLDGETHEYITMIPGGAAAEIATSFSDYLYDAYPDNEFEIASDPKRQVLIITNIPLRIKNSLVKDLRSMVKSFESGKPHPPAPKVTAYKVWADDSPLPKKY